jgi:short-subunit dehydrogenase
MNTKYALVTGGSSGIGKAICFELAKLNYNLLVVGRNEKNLTDLQSELQNQYKVEVTILKKDLSDLQQTNEIVNYIQSNKINLSVLVNNAGYGLWGTFAELDLDAQFKMLNVNVNSVIILTHKLLPILKQQAQSFIMNVSSTTAFQPVPYLGLYAASKSLVDSFTKSLQIELAKHATNISVSSLLPGTTDTGFIDVGGFNDKIKKMAKKVEMSPESVAKIAVKGMLNKKYEIIPGAVNWWSAKAVGFLPATIINNISKGIYEK